MSPSAGLGKSQAVMEKETGLAPFLRRNGRMILIGFGIFLPLFIWWGLRPVKGTVHLGVCRTIIELQIPYPETLRLTAIEKLVPNEPGGAALRLYFTHIDGFGQNRSEVFECLFGPGLALEGLKRNRVSLPPEKIARLAATVPFIIAAKPNRNTPGRPRDDLMSLKKD